MITIRDMCAGDIEIMSQAFALQGWSKPISQFEQYLEACRQGMREVIVALCDGQFAGYVTIVWTSGYPPFREAGIPEVVDFNVLIAFQRRGIGTALMDEAERRIGQRSPFAGLGVCLHADYGPAQVLYARRGYVPDGRGVSWRGSLAPAGSAVTLDDDLVLHLVKRLR